MGDGTDTANAILFRASDEARFITGVGIVVNGSVTMHCGRGAEQEQEQGN